MESQYVNRPLNTPSPVVFPSASPTPKLYSKPSKKVPDVQPWQELEISALPQMCNSNGREKETMLISNDSVIDESYFNEEEYLSSIISSTTTSPSPLRSFRSPSPQPIIGSPIKKEMAVDPIVERSYTEPEAVNPVSTRLSLFISGVKKVTSRK